MTATEEADRLSGKDSMATPDHVAGQDESLKLPAYAEVADDATVTGGEIMPFDDGSLSADKAQSSAMSLLVNYADPSVASGVAVFGLGLLVLPLLARLNLSKDRSGMFQYVRHGEANPRQPMRIFTESELKQRFGVLDADTIAKEITMTTDELDDHMNRCSMDSTDTEVSKIQKWREIVNGNLKALQKRSALAFLGLPPEASEQDISKMYKKLALEMHPDKGGDPEKFQELVEMKDRLNEAEKDDEKKKEEDADDEEAKKAKEKEKQEEEKQQLPPDERIKKVRMEAHDNTVRMWERAKKSRDEIVGEKKLKSDSRRALNILRMFVDRFVNNEIKTLRHDDVRGAEAKFRKFLKQGAEIIAVAAIQDVQATLSTISMHFNYRIVSRSGSVELKNRCSALLEAIAEIPTQCERFIKQVEDTLADAKGREISEKEARAKQQREREQRGDFSGDARSGCDARQAASPSNAKPKGKATAKAAAPAKGGTEQSPCNNRNSDPRRNDPFADFAFDDDEPQNKPPVAAASSRETAQSTRMAGVGGTQVLMKKSEDSKGSVLAEAPKQKATCWDPNFDHPYAGALKSDGSAVFCRPCKRWIMTYEYNVEVFFTHVERVHPQPPPGWN
mmetsp:Transcript_95248/g.188751  ORF Transcript_95248/g.188751 Transcript_95248/m.188751 type:complete len:619 (-) Transcript_95248:59-1915(-)